MNGRRNAFRFGFVMILATVMSVCLVTAPAFGAYNVKTIWQRFSAVAGETITRGNVVCLKAADGLVYKADANASTLRPAVGIAGNTASTGYSVEIIVAGIVDGWSSLTIGASGYLSETPAVITQSAPSYFQQVGFAISATTYLVNFRSYLDTSALTSLDILTGATPLRLDGATVDGVNVTVFNVTDPTGNRQIRVPDVSGDLIVSNLASVNFAAAAPNNVWALSSLQMSSTQFHALNASATGTIQAPSCTAGRLYVLDNESGQTMKFLVVNQAGNNVATAKRGLFICNGTDVGLVYTP